MNLRINGQNREVSVDLDVGQLLDELEVPQPTALVELNGRAILRREWASVKLRPGDSVEILRVAAGG